MPEPTSHLGLYRAGLTSPAHRQHITVARAPLVQDTLELLRGSMSRNSKHHFLFIGPRGIGKTHLIRSLLDDVTHPASPPTPTAVTTLRAVETGDWLWMLVQVTGISAQDGRDLSFTGQVAMRFEGDKIAEAYNHFDFISFFEQIGALPEETIALCLSGEQLQP